jgi:hypothetical protein
MRYTELNRSNPLVYSKVIEVVHSLKEWRGTNAEHF